MSKQNLRGTIQEFLDLCEGNSGPPSEVVKELALLLDRLALASHASVPSASWKDAETPRPEYQAVREKIVRRFPDFGLYLEGGTKPDDEILVGDAIDDICDILIDLSEVAWIRDHVGEIEARWEFHFGFDNHWGSHLRSLQWYIHETARAG